MLKEAKPMSNPELPLGAEPLSSSLFEQVQRISALNVITQAFSVWMRIHQKAPGFQCVGHAEGELAVNLILPDGSTEREAQDLFEVLEKCQRLTDLQVIIGELVRIGVEPGKIQTYMVEAESLAQELFPKPYQR